MYPNGQRGLGIAIPGAALLPSIPIIGGLFKRGWCPPTLPGFLESRCRYPDSHTFMVGREKWHWDRPKDRFQRIEPTKTDWFTRYDPRVPQAVRDTQEYIASFGRPPTPEAVPPTPPEVPPTPAAMPPILPILLLGGALLFLGKPKRR